MNGSEGFGEGGMAARAMSEVQEAAQDMISD